MIRRDTGRQLPEGTDVAIVGAGLSGLWAGVQLSRTGRNVCILEARDRVGGRTLSVSKAGTTLDLGAQWIGPTQERMYALCDELSLEIFPTAHTGRKILELDGRIRTYTGTIPRLNPVALFELHRLIKRTESNIESLESVDVFAGDHIAQLDAVTVGEWARKTIRTRSVKAVLRTAVRVIFGIEIDELSLFHFLRYCKAGGGLMKLCEIENAAQQDRVKVGTQTISQELHQRYLADSVFHAPVRAFSKTQKRSDFYGPGAGRSTAGSCIAISPLSNPGEIDTTNVWARRLNAMPSDSPFGKRMVFQGSCQ